MNSISHILFALMSSAAIFARTGWLWQNPKPQGSDLTSVAVLDANTAVAIGHFGTILRTPDDGANWTPQTSGTPFALNAVCFVDANNGWAAGNNGTIRRTSNGGATWTGQTSGTTNDLFDIFFTDANNEAAVGRLGTVLHTTDGGSTWNRQVSRTSQELHAVYFTGPNTGTMVGYYGSILRTTTGGVVGITQNPLTEIPRDFLLEQNYPNPFNPATRIEFRVPGWEFVSLKIYDILGRKVTTLVNQHLTAGVGERLQRSVWNGNAAGSLEQRRLPEPGQLPGRHRAGPAFLLRGPAVCLRQRPAFEPRFAGGRPGRAAGGGSARY